MKRNCPACKKEIELTANDIEYLNWLKEEGLENPELCEDCDKLSPSELKSLYPEHYENIRKAAGEICDKIKGQALEAFSRGESEEDFFKKEG